jgi:peptidoglycan/LPS O-acetylase OafA/YrhL
MNLNIEQCFRLFIFFESGLIIYLFKDLFDLKLNRLYYLIISLFIIIIFGKSNLTIDILLPPFVIYFATQNNKFSFIEKYGDYSYGLYLYGYIVQQFILSLKLNFMNEYFLFLFSFLLSFILAYLSWNLIEVKALKYKEFVK